MKKLLLLASAIFCFLNLTNAQAGKLDSSFGNQGIVKTYLGDSSTIYKNTAIQKDGKIVVAGSTWNGSNFEMVIVRYNTDGSPDSTFSNNGILTTGFTFPGAYRNNILLLIQNDGRIVAESAAATILARYNTDGTLDNTFSGDGKQTTNINISFAAVQKDGKIVVTGSDPDDEDIPVIARYNTDGSPDKTFGTNGKKTIILEIYDVSRTGYFSSIAIQKDGKIVLAGIFGRYQGSVIVRFNADGSLDTTFNGSGIIFPDGLGTSSFSVIIQDDDKIVLARSDNYMGFYETSLLRYNIDGSLDNSFNAKRISQDIRDIDNTSAAIQSDGKIVVSGYDLSRFNTDGSLDSTFNINARQEVDFVINDIAIANNKLYVAGGSDYGTVARYLLDNDSSQTPSTVTLTTPDSIVKYIAPARIKLNASVANPSAAITKVRFYNGSKWLHTETAAPYGFLWTGVPAGNYTLTAKAYDAAGNVITSNSITVSVTLPVVSITNPVHDTTLAGPATIRLIARAKDAYDRISKVEFFNGAVLLRTEYYYPYTYNWINIQQGTYTITAKATNSSGFTTTSAPVKVTVINANNKPIVADNKTGISLKLRPNPAKDVLQINTNGFVQGKAATISIISASGVVMKTFQANNQNQQINVSSLPGGVYTLKVVSEDKTIYKQFIKL